MDSNKLNNKEINNDEISKNETNNDSQENNKEKITETNKEKTNINEINNNEINNNTEKINKETCEFLTKKYNFEIRKELNKEKTVYEIKLNGKNFYVLKIKVLKNSMEQKIKSVRNEQMIAKKLKSVRIIKILTTFEVEYQNEWIIFVYFLEKSIYRDLKKFLIVFQKGYILRNSIHIDNKIKWIFIFSDVTISFFLHQIVLSILFLKLNKLNHYNLVPENILIGRFYILKLSGFSKILTDEQNNENKEENNNKDFNYFLLNIISDMYDIYKNKYNKQSNENDNDYSDELKLLIDNCSETDLNKRWKLRQILESEFFKKNKKYIKKIKNNVFNEEYKFFIEMQKIKFLKHRKKRKFIFKKRN